MKWLPLLLLLAAVSLGAADGPAGRVVTLRIADVIGPASADFFVRGLNRARDEGAALVVLELDTPGGLDTSMRQIIKAILASTVPVATFVSPEGARAASAGTYILYASHVAAMAPATNLGAATPVSIGGGPAGGGSPGDREKATAADPMTSKVTNDAVAYIRSLAELRGRDVEFAERAVREAASISAKEALDRGVIEIIAVDVPDLLRQLDGRTVRVAGGEVTLQTAGAPVETLEPDARSRLLGIIANPQVAVFLMMIGIYGLFYEFTSPGFGVPGIAGAILLMLGLYAFQLLPINWTGVALLALGAALVLAEAFVPSFGALGVGGLIAMVLGGLFLLEEGMPGFTLPPGFILGLALGFGLLFFLSGRMVARMRRRPVVSGREELLGAVGVITVVDADGTFARLHGESWQVRASRQLAVGDRVRVVRADGLTLDVEPVT